MKKFYIVGVLLAAAVIGGIWWYMTQSYTSDPTPSATTTPSTHGMTRYDDLANGFSFWYPSALSVTASTTNDALSFPGGIAVEKLQVGAAGDITIFVVNSPKGTITDQAAGHASPIAQTKYFYNTASSTWMMAFPDSASEGSSRATTTADVSKTTMGGSLMLSSGRRFNTTIIPLGTTRFLVVTDGGGSMFTPQLAKTVTPAGSSVDPSVQSSVLKAEADAYANQ